MILGIDASNIRSGGGVTHLVELLGAARPEKYSFSKVIVWSKQSTLDSIPDRLWLEKAHLPVFEKGLINRIMWQRFHLSHLVRQGRCDLLFVPGGSYAGKFHPIVSMSQNMLPFEWRELRRYGWSLLTLKFLLLRLTQSKTFKNADGLIFLTQYVQDAVSEVVQRKTGKNAVVPHGINERFFGKNRIQKTIDLYSPDQPYRIIYVSIVDMYKHQWYVAEAVAKLRKSGLPVELILVGPSYPRALNWLNSTLTRVDPENEFIRYVGSVPYAQLHDHYAQADLCLFASSCENLPNILLEGMASGLPIVCSNKGPMPEVLGDAGIYFDPEHSTEIAEALKKMIESPEMRTKLAKRSYQRVQRYSWERCADETFNFLGRVAIESRRK